MVVDGELQYGMVDLDFYFSCTQVLVPANQSIAGRSGGKKNLTRQVPGYRAKHGNIPRYSRDMLLIRQMYSATNCSWYASMARCNVSTALSHGAPNSCRV